PSFSYFLWSSARWGMLFMHGPHQVAQNSTMNTFLSASFSPGRTEGLEVIHLETLTGGAFSPICGAATARLSASFSPGRAEGLESLTGGAFSPICEAASAGHEPSPIQSPAKTPVSPFNLMAFP